MTSTSTQKGEGKTRTPLGHVRTATPADHELVLDAAVAAFIHDPLMLFWGDVGRLEGAGLSARDTKALRTFLGFTLKSCMSRGGRVNVVVVPADKDVPGSKEKIASAAIWFPPRKRLRGIQVFSLLNDGALGVLRSWGFGVVSRVGGFIGASHKINVETLKSRGLTRSPDDGWYLCLMFTHPEFQGKGCMSLLMKDQFAYAPTETYTLEASKEKTTYQYARFGFERQDTFRIGQGKVGMNGIPATGDEGKSGVTIYPMVKWGEADCATLALTRSPKTK